MKKTVLALTVLSVMLFAGDYEDGVKAYTNQDYKKAADIFRGIAKAQEDSSTKISAPSHEILVRNILDLCGDFTQNNDESEVTLLKSYEDKGAFVQTFQAGRILGKMRMFEVNGKWQVSKAQCGGI